MSGNLSKRSLGLVVGTGVGAAIVARVGNSVIDLVGDIVCLRGNDVARAAVVVESCLSTREVAIA